MKTFKAALFDLDGTLIDTEGQYSIIWNKIGRTFRPDIDHLELQIKGTTLTQILDRYFPRDTWEQVKEMIDTYESTMQYRFFPGALDFIADIRRHGVKCAIVTSSDKKKMAHLRRQIPEFDQLFDIVLTAEDFAKSKPDPDCYLRAAAAFNMPLSDCIVFEDAFNGLEAGMASGIFTVGLPTYNPADAIRSKCHYVLSSYESLTYEKFLNSLPNN